MNIIDPGWKILAVFRNYYIEEKPVQRPHALLIYDVVGWVKDRETETVYPLIHSCDSAILVKAEEDLGSHMLVPPWIDLQLAIDHMVKVYGIDTEKTSLDIDMWLTSVDPTGFMTLSLREPDES